MKKRLITISLLAASIIYVGVGLTNNGVTASSIVQGAKTALENVFIATYNVLSDNPLPAEAPHEAVYEREYHYTVKKIPVDNLEDEDSPTKNIKAVKSPLPLQEYLIQNTPN